MKKKTIVIAAAGTVAVLCVACLALALLTDTTPAPEPTATTAAAEATAPMDTPTPAEPTATPTPAMLTCREIEKKYNELTDLQWETYSQKVVGEQIRFAGKVSEVHDDGSVFITDATCRNLFTICYLYGIPLDVAATLNKGQMVEGKGFVRKADKLIGLIVEINVESLE